MIIALVKAKWVRGVLDQPLYRFARLKLQRDEVPSAIGRPMELTVRAGANMPRPLDPQISMGSLLSDLGAFLILGAPGAGKSTLLAEIVRDVAESAEQFVAAPLPVALSLAR
jgi:Cdc6-like AAA superfamily ATPase